MRLLLICALLAGSAAFAYAGAELVDTGYRQMYNLDFGQAHNTFREWERSHPEDPIGPVSDAAAYLFSEFDRLHILQAEFFLEDSRFKAAQRLTPDPVIKRQFDAALARGQQLIERSLAREPRDKNAMFANILRLGLRADYMALIEKRYLTSLGKMKDGRAMAERLVASDPNYYDAYLAIGVENYMLSLKPAPVRWVLRIGGAQTDKDEGIRKLKLTAEKGHYLKPFARLLLAVAALRDRDQKRARTLLEGLAREFPRNYLYAQELARIGD